MSNTIMVQTDNVKTEEDAAVRTEQSQKGLFMIGGGISVNQIPNLAKSASSSSSVDILSNHAL
jgi:hypothetical protein